MRAKAVISAANGPCRTCPPTDQSPRVRRWKNAVASIQAWQAEYAAWLDALPGSQQDNARAETSRTVVDLDLSELLMIEPPRCFGRD
jgi:hypothetical protein